MPSVADKIFISYRRGESGGHAGRLHDRLVQTFGPGRVFMDVDSIPLGTNFIDILRAEVAQCGVLLAVMGKGWLDARDDKGNRKLDNSNDPVRLEISSALQREIPVIPVLLDDARFPDVEMLPDGMTELPLRNWIAIHHTSFHADVDRLIEALKKLLAERREQREAEERRAAEALRKAAARAKELDAATKPAKLGSSVRLEIILAVLLASGLLLAMGAAHYYGLKRSQGDPPNVPTTTNWPEDVSVSAAGNESQYVIDKLKLREAHKISTGEGVLIAVIDTAVDARHPDLVGSVRMQIGDGCTDTPGDHGTAMVSAIAAHGRVLGVAPKAKIILICEFSGRSSPGGIGGTKGIVEGIEFALTLGARVISMSFSGPLDPVLKIAIKKAYEKNAVIIAPVGNAGPKSPPLYPGADPFVIAVTAVDRNDVLYKSAVRGKHVAIAAPGVDILASAPNGQYQLSTGTSIASAHVTGVAALLLAQKPSRTPEDIRRILMSTAVPFEGGAKSDFGAGLVDPLRALQQGDL